MALAQNLVQAIIQAKEDDLKLREQGLGGKSNRAIALEILGKGSKESTVRNIWKKYRDDGNCRGVDLSWVEVSEVATEEEADVATFNDTQTEEYTLDEIPEALLQELIKGDDKAYANLARRLLTAQKTNTQLRRVHRGTVDTTQTQTVEEVVASLSTRLNSGVFNPVQINNVEGQTKRTVEVLFSDLQIGKCSEYYNTEVAKKALAYYGQEVLNTIRGVKPEHIVFASLGDVVEDHLKHGVQSAISTDTGLAEQMADAIEHVWHSVLAPLFELCIPVTFIGIVGNHGSSEHKGMDMYQAGRYGYDYTIYKTWQTMCDIANYNHVNFKLPVGCFETHDIYGQKYLYEHGYSNQVSEKQMEDHKKKRQENLKQYIHGYRQGDKHHSVQYDNSNLMCNGAFFGIEQQGAEYSGILGFNSIPVQAVVIHEPVSGVGKSTISGVVQIQIAKGY